MIKEIEDKKEWENFAINFDKRTFLNSWNWGEFRKSIGDRIYRRGLWLDGKLEALFFTSIVHSKKGKFLLVPHAPLIKESSIKDLLPEIIKDLRSIAKKERASFIRIAPLWDEKVSKRVLGDFVKSQSSVFPEKSWQLDLSLEEDAILSGMKKNTRYSIRKALKDKTLEIVEEDDINHFYEIYKKTSLRQRFKPFSFDYLEKEMQSFLEDNQAKIFLAKKGDKFVSAAFVVFWQGIAFYHHGASSANSGFASHLIQWQIIKEARKRGCHKYNFWAIAPNEDKNHPWAGLTFFKKSFGGQEISYSQARDIPIKLNYWITYIFEKIKR